MWKKIIQNVHRYRLQAWIASFLPLIWFASWMKPLIGRESIDPVVLMKIVILQYVFGIPSMRKTIKGIEVNLAHRWYLGYGLYEDIPHFFAYACGFLDTESFLSTYPHQNQCKPS